MNQSLLADFGLTYEQTRILLSLELYIAQQDADSKGSGIIKLNPFRGKRSNKEVWCRHFHRELNEFLTDINPDKDEESLKILTTIGEIVRAVNTATGKNRDTTWKYMILMECVQFTPYYPLYENVTKNKVFKGLKASESIKNEALDNIANWLGLNPDFIKKFKDSYKDSIRLFTGYWTKVAIGMGAGIVAAVLTVVTMGGSIAALFATSGLYGAAAVSSGLAALGGGAIAAGGFGMVGGMVVLVSGGILLGSGGGATISMMLAKTNPNGFMLELVKLSVFVKEIILGVQQDTKRVLEIYEGIIGKIGELKKEISKLQMENKKNKEQIKNLEKSISYLEKFLKMKK